MCEGGTLLTVISIIVAIIGLMSGAYPFVVKEIFDRLNSKCNKDMCNAKHEQVAAKHEQIDRVLQKVDERFDKIMDKLESISTTLALLVQSVNALDSGRLSGNNTEK